MDAIAEATAVAESAGTVAFYQYTGAEYALLSGDLDAAETGYADALESLPGYPLAVVRPGSGRVRAWRHVRSDPPSGGGDGRPAAA